MKRVRAQHGDGTFIFNLYFVAGISKSSQFNYFDIFISWTISHTQVLSWAHAHVDKFNLLRLLRTPTTKKKEREQKSKNSGENEKLGKTLFLYISLFSSSRIDGATHVIYIHNDN